MHKFFKSTLLLALVAGSFAADAQTSTRVKAKTKQLVGHPSLQKSAVKPRPVTGFEPVQAATAPALPPAEVGFRSGLVEEIVGTTTYDLQSNGGETARLHTWPDGNISTAFIVSNANDGTGWADRGTGYNQRSAWTAGTSVNSRIEASTRTGFTSYVVTESGVEFAVAHRSAGTGKFLLHYLRRAPGQSAWTEGDIPTAVPVGQLWCKAAVDGETIYVIALTNPSGGTTGGAPYLGVDGLVLFWRSSDGGLTWDKQDFVIPGIDNNNFAAITAEGYSIDARDGTVAVGIFDSWNDAIIVKSSDRGDNWDAPLTALDFPLTKYKADQGYTIDDIGGPDPNGPDSMAIFTQDGAAALLIDNAGLVHAWFGAMYVIDTDLTDGNSNYYPGWNGLLYWNESSPEDLFLVGDIVDANGNDTIDITSSAVVAYGCNMSSMPTSAIDEDGNLYLAYSAVVDNLFNDAGLVYRHVLVTKSFDYGATWTDPVDVHYATNDPLLADFQEGVYPFFEKRVKNQLNMVYQRDYLPGASVLTTAAEPAGSTSDIVFIANADLVGTKNTLGGTLDFALAPNPASDFARVSFTTEKSAELVLEIFNTLGARVKTQVVNAPAGPVTLDVNTSDLGTGLYFVRVGNGKDFGTRKLMISKN